MEKGDIKIYPNYAFNIFLGHPIGGGKYVLNDLTFKAYTFDNEGFCQGLCTVTP